MDHYALFSFEPGFVIDRTLLQTRYRDLQRAMHPDRFVSAGNQERRIAMQKSTQINEAFRILNDSMERARYLLNIRGYAWDDDSATVSDIDFLMTQMTLRESIAEVKAAEDPFAVIGDIMGHIMKALMQYEQDLTVLFDEASESANRQAAEIIKKMQFFRKLEQEAFELEAELEDMEDA